MSFTRMRVAGIVAGLAFVVLPAPVLAGSTSVTDGVGIDYDAACLRGTWPAGPPNGAAAATPDSVQGGAPGGSLTGGAGCAGLSHYDGSAASSDLRSASLSTGANPSDLSATFTIGTPVAPAGSTTRTAADLSDDQTNNASIQLLIEFPPAVFDNTDNPAGGCTSPGGTRVRDQHGAWQDGYHFFIAFTQRWDGAKWIHRADIGEYDPSPDGGFSFTELGRNDGSGWVNADPNMVFGVDWSVTVSGATATVDVAGIVKQAAPGTCAGGVYKTVYAQPGDRIASAKALTLEETGATLPVVVPTSLLCLLPGGLCMDDVTAVGGYRSVADTTAGNSTVGVSKPNISGIAYTNGALGGVDTLGDGPTCPTPTFGGTLPQNPLFVPGTACQIDDDPVGRGSLFIELWDTPHSFTL